MAIEQTHTPPESEAAPGSTRRERLWLGAAALTFVLMGAGLWVTNGARTFGELMLGAFSWCF